MTAPATPRDVDTSSSEAGAAHQSPPTIDPVVARNRATWTAGDFERIAAGYRSSAEAFVARLDLARGELVLDVACGTGNLALPAARCGATVVGIDIAPNLIETGRRRAAGEGVEVRFDEGNCESLPYADGSFDTAITMFGAMFAPHPDRAASELMRVVRPGGRIAMANWTPGSFVGAMLRAHVALVPPPAGVPSALLWGDEGVVRERLAATRSIACARRAIQFDFPMSPEDVVRLFRDYYGPTVRTFEALDDAGKARLFANLVALWSDANQATDGTTRVESEFLEVVAER